VQAPVRRRIALAVDIHADRVVVVSELHTYRVIPIRVGTSATSAAAPPIARHLEHNHMPALECSRAAPGGRMYQFVATSETRSVHVSSAWSSTHSPFVGATTVSAGGP